MNANWAATWALIAIVLWLLSLGLRKAERAYEFPFLAGVMTFSFILLQLPALANDPFLPEGAYVKTIFLTICCLLMLRLGWALPARPLRMLHWTFDERKLLILASLFSVAGSYFYFKLSNLPGELVVGVQMSGLPVVYLFFARLLTYGLAVAVPCFARRPSFAAALIIGFDLLFYLDRIVITGKRAEAIELFMIFLLAFWFQRRWAVPRLVTVAAIVIGTFAMISMSDYRQITRANSGPVWEQIASIDLVANFNALIEGGGPEMRNAVLRIDAIDRTKDFDFGKFHWNRLVFEFFPSQVFGTEAKQALMLPMPQSPRDYDPDTGTTETGMSDAFQSFWYFGALKFLLLSNLMLRIWRTAVAGEAFAQIVYTLSIVPAMHSISHETDWVVPVWVHMTLFLVPALALTVVRQRSATPRLNVGTFVTG
ncbi:MAG: hypothetical protein JWN11_1458 [Hyphomicrobiales bacterium]|nr:hypothetical protein [Hyphomicrobiales bacterium]